MKKFIAIILTLTLSLTALAAGKAILSPEEIPLLAEDSSEASGLNELGILLGTENGFELDRKVTRAEAVVLLMRMHPEVTGSMGMPSPEFEDMEGHWAYREVTAAKKIGLVNGTDEKNFTPDRTVTGKEFAKMTLCLLGYENITIENAFDLGEKYNLISNKFTRSVIYDNCELLRGDAARICWSALIAKTSDNKLLHNKLIEAGKYEFDDFYGLLFVTDRAAETETFADRLNSYMPEDKNYMFSPLSIKMAFAMAANGAEGETKSQIEAALGITNLDAFNLYSMETMERYSQSDIIKLNIANSIWLNSSNTSQRFSSDYSTGLKAFYDAEAFVRDKSSIVADINGWVSEKTNGKITTIADNSDFWAMLVNAVYFNGRWQNEFSENATKEDVFTDSDGNENKTQFMNRTAYYNYFKDENSEIISLPYKNASYNEETGESNFCDLNISMYLVKGDFSESILSKAAYKGERTYVSLSMPKFRFEYNTSLKETMAGMGVLHAFNETRADFSGMFDGGNMFITDGIHKTYISVDEKGTEAAAVTALSMAGSALPPEPIEVKYNEPFTFVIRDNDSGEILFLGRYAFTEEK